MLHDLIYWLEILFLLFGILVSCQVFTNAIENLGDELNLNHEFTGSILAAVGTALPETILPLVAIYMASQAAAEGVAAKNEIAIGAIIGAPFMLATLAMLLLGLSIYTHQKQRKKKFKKGEHLFLQVNKNHLKRDLIYFLIIFAVAIGATFFATDYVSQAISYLCSQEWGVQILNLLKLHGDIPTACFEELGFGLKIFTSLLIVALYIIYLIQTYKASQGEIGDEEDDTPLLYLVKYLNLKKSNMNLVIIQTLIGLGGIIYFAHHFVHGVEHIADLLSISPLVLSLIVSPIATELPEKVNSWIWSSEGKDTLAMGNLSGAMVFQAAIPCIVGILLTPWALNELVFLCSGLCIISTVTLLLVLEFTHKIGYRTLLAIGSLYLVYLVLIAKSFI